MRCRVYDVKDSIRNNLKRLTKDIIGKSDKLISYEHKFPVDKDMLNRTMLIIEGKKITVKKYLIFEVYSKTGNMVKTAEICNVSESYIYKLKNEDWFGALQHEFIDSKQRYLHMELSEHVNLLRDSMIKIWKGEIDPKLASAVVRSFEAYCKMGKLYGQKYVEPLISNKQEIKIDNSVTENKTLNINIQQAVENMSEDEINFYSKTGELPKAILEAAEEGAIPDTEEMEESNFDPMDL